MYVLIINLYNILFTYLLYRLMIKTYMQKCGINKIFEVFQKFLPN